MVEYDRRGSYVKFAAQFIFILLVATGSYIGLKSWQIYQGQREVADIQHRIEQILAERDAAMRADTVGGVTPQETLQMYIDAVEKGDYTLASKYFVHESQDEELDSLAHMSEENRDEVVRLLKRDIINIPTLGSYNEEKDGFVIRKPLLVDFRKYPSGVWKIIEI
jgi:hypothetical protein